MEKVAGSTTTVYIFSGAKVIAEYANGAAPSSPTREYIYAGGALLARIDSSGTNYYHQDHLSNRMVTNSSGGVVAEMGHFPFGESWYNATNDKLYFTTYEYDAESGNHYAMARYHVSRLGRLSSPDPLAGSTADPQSLNRYSYSINDPANVTDPSGAGPVSGCTTAQANPKDKSQQASTGGHSDPDNSDADTDDADADSPQQSGCVSHVNPYGNSGDFGSDWAAEFGVEGVGTFDGGPPMADVPPGMFTVTSIGGRQGIGNWIWLPPDTIQDFQGEGKDKQLLGSRSDPGEWLELGVPSSPGDSGDGSSWWGTFGGTFLNGVLHGVRQPSQSFKTCVLQNADKTTFGGHKAVIAAVLVTASAAVSNASRVNIPNAGTVSGTANIALYFGRFVFLASGGTISGLSVIRPVANTIGFAGRAAPYVLAAEAGLLIGSAINCR